MTSAGFSLSTILRKSLSSFELMMDVMLIFEILLIFEIISG